MHKLTEPAFQPVYDYGECVDTIEAYDQLCDELLVIAGRFPDDEHHATILKIAELSLISVREREVDKANGLQERIKEERLSSKLYTQSGLSEARAKYMGLARKNIGLDKRELLPHLDVKEGSIEQEPEAVEGTPLRRLTREQVIAVKAHREFVELQAAVQDAKLIIKRRVVAKTQPQKDLYTEITGGRPADLVQEFLHINNLIYEARPLMIERDLVRLLFPDLYKTDRPEAYRQLDDKFSLFLDIDSYTLDRAQAQIIHRGIMHRADHSGRALNKYGDIVYTAMPSGTNIKPGVNQRINLDNEPFVITWQNKFPNWGGPNAT